MGWPTARSGYQFESLDYPATERRFNCYFAQFLAVAPDKLRLHDHSGVDFIYTIEGTLSVHVGAEEYALKAGDSLYFDPACRTPTGAAAAGRAARWSSQRAERSGPGSLGERRPSAAAQRSNFM